MNKLLIALGVAYVLAMSGPVMAQQTQTPPAATDTTDDDSGFDPGWIGLLGLLGLGGLAGRRRNDRVGTTNVR